MKKSLIALAVAGALTAPMIAQADATVYGSLRVNVIAEEDKDLVMGDNTSRIGIKGTQETNIDGVVAGFNFEQKVETQDGAFGAGRLANVSLKTGSGSVILGRQWSPHYLFVSSKVDILDTSASGSTATLGRVGNVAAYVSPEMGGVTLALAAPMSSGGGTDSYEDLDSLHFAVKAKIAEGLEVAGSYVNNRESDDKDIMAVAASYSMGAMYAAALYTDNDAKSDPSLEIAGSYSVNDQVKLLAQFVDFGGDDGSQSTIEASYQLGKKARAALAYTVKDEDAGNDFLQFSYRVDF